MLFLSIDSYLHFFLGIKVGNTKPVFPTLASLRLWTRITQQEYSHLKMAEKEMGVRNIGLIIDIGLSLGYQSLA